jgi:hypothetical protein
VRSRNRLNRVVDRRIRHRHDHVSARWINDVYVFRLTAASPLSVDEKAGGQRSDP